MQFIRLLSEGERNEQQNNVVCVWCVLANVVMPTAKGKRKELCSAKKEIYILDQGALGNTTTGVM